MRTLADKGISVVMTSSETEELLAICDRLIVLSEGRVMGEVYSYEVDYQDVMRLLSGQADNTPQKVGETR